MYGHFTCPNGHFMKPRFEYRIVILIILGGFSPVAITTVLNRYFNYSIQESMELTFVFCIPIAVWMALKINERWHDDED